MKTKRLTLTNQWQRLGRGPALIQASTQGSIYLSVGSETPTNSDGHHVIDQQNSSFSYGGNNNIYGRSIRQDVQVTVTAAVLVQEVL